MRIRDILTAKGTDVVTVMPDVTVLNAIEVLVENNIGAVVVMENDAIAGIISERDVLRLSARSPGQLGSIRVRDVMTTEVILGNSDHDMAHVMELMTRNRIRHLPVVDGGTLAGILSIGDVVNALRQQVEGENRFMREYIQGEVR